MTLKELANKEGVGLDAMRQRFNAARQKNAEAFPSAFDCNAEISPEQISLLTKNRGETQTKNKAKVKAKSRGEISPVPSANFSPSMRNETAQVSPRNVPEISPVPEKSEAEISPVKAEAVLGYAINLSTISLIVLGCWTRWDLAGAMAAAIVATFMVRTIIILERPEQDEAASYSIIGISLIELCAVWLHVQTFLAYLNRSATMADTVAAWVFSLLLAYLSITTYWNNRLLKL
jgi:hypothetical protein